MKEIVVISGKGGTGKTSITASFAHLAGEKAVIADCDVDAADMHILLEPEIQEETDFYSGNIAKIDNEKCINCLNCISKCHFDAIHHINNAVTIDELTCEGCGFCYEICPIGAITFEPDCVGKWFSSTTKYNQPFAHAVMGIGAENSGKLVTKIKSEAKDLAIKNKKDLIIVDGSPGIGCPVIASLSGTDTVVIVTEATMSGFSDFKRVHQLVQTFNTTSTLIINKHDLNSKITEQIKDYASKNNIELLGIISYDEEFSQAITEGIPITEFSNNQSGKIIKDCWQKLTKLLLEV